jgi:hypothetical protein
MLYCRKADRNANDIRFLFFIARAFTGGLTQRITSGPAPITIDYPSKAYVSVCPLWGYRKGQSILAAYVVCDTEKQFSEKDFPVRCAHRTSSIWA